MRQQSRRSYYDLCHNMSQELFESTTHSLVKQLQLKEEILFLYLYIITIKTAYHKNIT